LKNARGYLLSDSPGKGANNQERGQRIEMFSAEIMKNLAAVSLGEKEADLVVKGADLVNVYTREVLKGYSVATKGKWIAYVGPDANHTIGSGTKVIDGAGKVLIPGFVDGHTHMLYYASPQEFLRYAMRGGTTTIVTEIMELTFPLGYSGLIEYLETLKNQPIKIFSTVPPSVTLSRDAAARAPTLTQLLELLKRDDLLGVGEGFWQQVLRSETNFPALSAEALNLRKTAEGHAAGCRGQRLAAYLDYGVSSCHESVSAEEVVEKLRFGLCTMIREGSIRKELEAIARIKDMGLDLRRAALVTDGADPRDLVGKGYLEHVVQRAIDAGFDPVLAIQMASLNVAEHFRLDGMLGGIAPAKYADLVLIPDLRTIKAEYVISNGVIIAQDGKLLVEPRPAVFRGSELKKIHLSPDDFAIKVQRKDFLKVRVMDQVADLVTKEVILDLPAHDGELKADPQRDILKASVISCEGNKFTGLVRGQGFRAGAMATSGAWETFATVVVGASETDMAMAVNRIFEMGGGIVVCSEGKVRAELALPVAGLMSNQRIEEIAERLTDIQAKAKALGFRFSDATLTLAVLTTAAIPFLRLSEEGLVDSKTGQVVDLVVS
jgi:adenine deaminase